MEVPLRNMKTGVAIHWFRQDLRLNDNPSLESASQYENIIPIYILDDINPGEFEMGSAEAVRLLEEYAEEGKGVSYARRAILGHDRNRPGTIIQIIFFDSAEEAELNNELEITQRGGEEFAARALDVQFTDVDVITDITI